MIKTILKLIGYECTRSSNSKILDISQPQNGTICVTYNENLFKLHYMGTVYLAVYFFNVKWTLWANGNSVFRVSRTIAFIKMVLVF